MNLRFISVRSSFCCVGSNFLVKASQILCAESSFSQPLLLKMWKRALVFAVLVFVCPNIECKGKEDGENSSKHSIGDICSITQGLFSNISSSFCRFEEISGLPSNE